MVSPVLQPAVALAAARAGAYRRCAGMALALFVAQGALPGDALAAEAEAEAPSAWSIGVGLKAWSTRWATWQIGNSVVGTNEVDNVSQLESGSRLAWVPVLGVRHGRYFATASAMTTTKYDLTRPQKVQPARREEFDVNVGVDLLAGLSASLGAKRIAQDGGGRFLWKGPVMGLNANAALSGPLSMYGTFGLGRLRLTLPVADPAGQRRLAANYTLGEWGLAWRRQAEAAEEASRSVFTLGYRIQVVRTRQIALGSRAGGIFNGVYGYETLRDVTEGWTLTWAYSY